MEEDQKDLRRLGQRGARRRKKKKMVSIIFCYSFPSHSSCVFLSPSFYAVSFILSSVERGTKSFSQSTGFYNLFFSCPEFAEIYMLRTTSIQC